MHICSKLTIITNVTLSSMQLTYYLTRFVKTFTLYKQAYMAGVRALNIQFENTHPLFLYIFPMNHNNV